MASRACGGLVRVTIKGAGLVVLVAACLGVGGCGSNEQYSPTAEVVERCGRLGGPVTAAKLVEVFRANGITLDVNYWDCERSQFTEIGATNAGLNGLASVEEVERREGSVLCSLSFERAGSPRVEAVKFQTDTETHLGVRNVKCSVYPSDQASEATQVRRLRDALSAVRRAVPETPSARWCGSRGAPVTLDDTAEILRHNGFTMRVNQEKCERPASNEPDATNLGPGARENEGVVSCWVGTQKDPFGDLKLGEERNPPVTVRQVSGRTTMTVLNVRCTIDPSEENAARQRGKLRSALEWL
jgi:hypothetical protein